MFGGHAFGDLSIGDDDTLVLYIRLALEATISFEFRIFVSEVEFITDSDDTPPNQPYAGLLDEPMEFTWSLLNGGGFGGFVTGRGSLVINNSDGGYDFLPQQYTTDGRPVEIRLGRVGDPQSTWPIVFSGLSSGEFIDDTRFEISLEDNGYKFDVPAQATVYAGTGGLEGGSDLEGKPRPLAYGWVLNIEPPLVIPAEYLFQVHDGAVEAISSVYDNGVALTFSADYATVALLRAASIPAGRYATCLAEGYFRIVFDVTPSGAVTADVQGDNTDSSFSETTVDIIRALIDRSTELIDPDDLYLPSFTALDALQPAPVGIYIGHNDVVTVAEVIAQLINGIGGYAGFRRDGKLMVGRIDEPSGTPVKRFDRYAFDPNPVRERLPEGIWPPPAKWLVGYAKNYTRINNPAGSVTEARRAFLAEEYRFSIAEAAAIKVDHPFGRDPDPVPALFRDKADADDESARRLALYRVLRSFYRFGVDHRDAALLNFSNTVFVTHARGDLTLGRTMTIMQIVHQGKNKSAQILAYG